MLLLLPHTPLRQGWVSGKDNGMTVHRLKHLFRLFARLEESVNACPSVLSHCALDGEGACSSEVDDTPEVGKVAHDPTNGLDDGRGRADTQVRSEAFKSFCLQLVLGVYCIECRFFLRFASCLWTSMCRP